MLCKCTKKTIVFFFCFQVKMMLKEFMLYNLLPQLLRNDEGKMLYTNDTMKAAVIMLCVCKEYYIRLSDSESVQLCTQLCLPKLRKEEFTKFWTDFFPDVGFLRRYVFHSAQYSFKSSCITCEL